MNETTKTYKCGNCFARKELDHSGHGGPICPNCKVEEMTAMSWSECPKCQNDEFKLFQRAQGESITGADPTAICLNCGRSGQVDDDGIWW